MLFIKALVKSDSLVDDYIEYFNLDKVLTIKPNKDGTSKILMGAGLYWNVYTASMERVDIKDII